MKKNVRHFFCLVRRWYDKKTFRAILGLFLLPLLMHATVLPAAWILDTTVNGVEFYHSIQECNGKQVVLLKFNNKNSASVKVSWKELFTTQVEAKAPGGAGQKELVIPKGVTMPANCTDAVNKKNIILSSEVSPAYVAEIKGFAYKDILVSKTK
jgi:hypothetical protein